MHLTLDPYQLGAILGASALYTVLISHDPLLALDNAVETRWMTTAGGIVLVVIIATWQGPASMLDLLVAFGISAAPVWVRAAWFGKRERERAELERIPNGPPHTS
jgi:hypothetical protein